MRGMHIQRPIIVTDKQKMYGDAFHKTQGHQHAYECVQPLQGLITFGEPGEDEYDFNHNNVSVRGKGRPTPETLKKSSWKNFDTVIYIMLLGKFIFALIMLGDIENQTVYNEVYLTYFMPSTDYSTYSVEAAGMTNPLYCMLISLNLVIFSVIIGLTSNKKYMLDTNWSCVLFFVLFILQGFALELHIMMLVNQNTQLNPQHLTTFSMLLLHALTFILSLVGLSLLLAAPQSEIGVKNQPKTEFMRKVAIVDGVLVSADSLLPVDQATTQQYEDFRSQKIMTHEDIRQETTSNFWLCVVEDLNTILCYAFLVRACDAQASIHDDSATFFDVLCVVFLGFLQHVANILMIFYAHIQKHTELNMRNEADDKKGKMKTQLREILTFIAHTRVLLFFMIAATFVFFFLRVAPTTENSDIHYIVYRGFALGTMVFLNTVHSGAFEVQNMHTDRTSSWETSPLWKLGSLSFISLVLCITLWFNTTLDKSNNTRQLLHKLKTTVSATPAPPPATTIAMTITPPPSK